MMRRAARAAATAAARGRRAAAAAATAETEAWTMNRTGGVEVLQYGPKTLRVGSDELLIDLAGGGVNPVDTYIRKGIYAAQPALPFTPGLEGAGRVAAAGEAVTGVAVGDPVAFTVTAADGGFPAMSGSYARQCVVKAALALPVPPSVDLAAAAALPIAYLAAHRALFHAGHATPHPTQATPATPAARAGGRDRILIRGASGAVGLAAVHLARRCGGEKRYIVGTATPEEAAGAWGDRIRHWGADACVAHDHDSVAGHGPFDLVIEQVARFNLASDASLLAPGGRIVIVGSPPQADGRSLSEFDARQLMTKEASIRGLFLWLQNAEERRAAAALILQAWEGWTDQPPVHLMPLSDAVQAQEMVDPAIPGTKGYDGKIVLVP